MKNNFDLHNVDDISVYVRKDVHARNGELHIYLSKFLWVKDLAVDGISFSY